MLLVWLVRRTGTILSDNAPTGRTLHLPYYYDLLAYRNGHTLDHPPVPQRERMAPLAFGDLPEARRENLATSMESEFSRSRLRHSRSALVLPRPRACDAGDRAGDDRHRQDDTVAEHHLARTRPRCWTS